MTAITGLEADLKTAAAAAEGNASSGKALADTLAMLKEKQKMASKEAMANYEKVLTLDAANYDALYNLGVFYYNEAVQIKSEVDNMSMTEYQQRGKEVEGRVCGRFKKAKPYFEKAIQVKDEAEAKENLTTVNSILEQFAGKGVACTEE